MWRLVDAVPSPSAALGAEPSWTLLAVLAGLLLATLVAWWWERTRAARASRRRNRVARHAESEAERLLHSHGYQVVERQASASWTLGVDGAALRVSSRVDLLVERDGRLFLADVKSGDEAPAPTAPATRRQLLEYQLAFAVDGVLLVDMAGERILCIDFADLLRRV